MISTIITKRGHLLILNLILLYIIGVECKNVIHTKDVESTKNEKRKLIVDLCKVMVFSVETAFRGKNQKINKLSNISQ